MRGSSIDLAQTLQEPCSPGRDHRKPANSVVMAARS